MNSGTPPISMTPLWSIASQSGNVSTTPRAHIVRSAAERQRKDCSNCNTRCPQSKPSTPPTIQNASGIPRTLTDGTWDHIGQDELCRTYTSGERKDPPACRSVEQPRAVWQRMDPADITAFGGVLDAP